MRNDSTTTSSLSPLPSRLRPDRLADVVGQEALLGEHGPLRRMLDSGVLRSVIFWGPPGVGKTTIALLLAKEVGAEFEILSAVSSGIRDVREAIQRGKELKARDRRLVLFIDEIHRFNKSQQDALLPAVEDGSIILIGATTENPSFEIIRPLLSRVVLFVLQPLDQLAMAELLKRVWEIDERFSNVTIEEEARELLFGLSGGDGRKLLTGIDLAVDLRKDTSTAITPREIRDAFSTQGFYDKGGEGHYDIISAFIKSIRGSDPDAALFWGARMLEAGEDPLFIARRLIILASEDIGNADPYAITLATNTFLAIERIGMPECRIVLGQCITYLATALKSNASYNAINKAVEEARAYPHLFPPLHLRNAPTSVLKNLGYGKGYKYAHDYPEGFVDQQYFPDELVDRVYYYPADRGREGSILERLRAMWRKRKR